jgi:hypothetical protein
MAPAIGRIDLMRPPTGRSSENGFYAMEGDEFVEIACDDDLFFEPIGMTLQVAITWQTELRSTYWIQVGGVAPHASKPSIIDSGRLKLSVD